MRAARLTKRRIDALKPRTPARDGRQVWKIVGQAGSVGVDDARGRAKDMLAAIRDGIDTQGALPPDILFGAVADEVLRRCARNWKPPTLTANRNYCRNHVLPCFKGHAITDITVHDVRRWFASMHHTPVSANRSAPILSVIMRQADTYGYRHCVLPQRDSRAAPTARSSLPPRARNSGSCTRPDSRPN